MTDRIDTHAHILPRDWPDLASRYNDPRFPVIDHSGGRHIMYRDGRFFREIDERSWDPELRIADYARFEVGTQVISTVPVMFCYWAPGSQALELHRALNDHVAELCRSHPRHYRALATVPLQAPGLAIAELERCVKELGLSGVQIGSHVNDWNLDAVELGEFFAACEALDAAVLVHPWDMMGAGSMPKYWLPWLVGMPAEQSRAICSLIFGGVLEQRPRLRVAFAHGGGSFPYTLGRIEHGFRMRPDLVAVDNPRPPREYLSRLYFDSCVHDDDALDFLIRTCGADRIMLGTDYPFPLGEQEPGSHIARLPLGEAERQRLYRGTALEWLGEEPAAQTAVEGASTLRSH